MYLDLYYVDMKYVRNLSRVNNHLYSVSPQTGKQERPFLGVITILNNKSYCIPLTSPKEKHLKKSQVDMIKIFDDKCKNENGASKLIGVLNLNNMIPVCKDVISKINLSVSNSDSPKQKNQKHLMQKQIQWCRNNSDVISNRANKVYRLVTNEPEKNKHLVARSSDFKKLEQVLEKYLINKTQKNTSEKVIVSPNSESIVINTKTTGNILVEDELLQVSIINDKGTVLYNEYVKPTAHKSWERAMAVNHITPEMVADKQTIQEQLAAINAITSTAKEVIAYDMLYVYFLCNAGVKFADDVKTLNVIDTYLELHGVWNEKKGGYNDITLAECAEHYVYGWDSREKHSSISECQAALICYNELEGEKLREQKRKASIQKEPSRETMSLVSQNTPSKHPIIENCTRRKR